MPTPKGKDRDEREYVVSATSSTGGVQRFKFGHHGAAHRDAAMIAYVQEQTFSYWLARVNGWIRDLSSETGSTWSLADALQARKDGADVGLCTLYSRHQRGSGMEEIALQHLWIKMN